MSIFDAFITFQDGTRYKQINNQGTLVRDPKKISGRDRKRYRKTFKQSYR